MKRLISLVLPLISFFAFADKSVSLAEQGDEAYSNRDFSKAAELYEKSIINDGSSSDIFYNLGNAYYRLDSLSGAVIAFERALKLDPTNSDARWNLEFVRTKLADAQGDSSSYSTIFIERTMRLMTGNGWAITSLIFFAIFLTFVGLYILSQNERVRKVSFFSGLGMLAITVASVVITIMVTARQDDTSHAVITVNSSQLSTSPATPINNTQQAFVLHEGTKVEVIDSVATPMDATSTMWYEVKVGSEHRAWIPKDHVVFI